MCHLKQCYGMDVKKFCSNNTYVLSKCISMNAYTISFLIQLQTQVHTAKAQQT